MTSIAGDSVAHVKITMTRKNIDILLW